MSFLKGIWFLLIGVICFAVFIACITGGVHGVGLLVCDIIDYQHPSFDTVIEMGCIGVSVVFLAGWCLFGLGAICYCMGKSFVSWLDEKATYKGTRISWGKVYAWNAGWCLFYAVFWSFFKTSGWFIVPIAFNPVAGIGSAVVFSFIFPLVIVTMRWLGFGGFEKVEKKSEDES